MIKKISAVFLLFMAMLTCNAHDFVSVKGTKFYRGEKAYHFVGTNFWYGPILGSEGQGGDRDRLIRELDSLKSIGVNNLRILVGAESGSENANSVKPYLQPEPGVLNDTLLAGLDFMLVEMAKREMYGVLFLTNSWDWSGGFGFYLKETGYGHSPNAAGEGYNDYVKYSADFVREKKALKMYYEYVKKIVSRKNRYTGKAYKDDPTIMSWQICNEPRPFSKENKKLFQDWINKTASIIKKIDPNHLVSTGSEGLYGCEVDEVFCTDLHNGKNIDYLTVHIWPVNWGWSSRDRLYDALPNVYVKAGNYIDIHIRMAEKINKPMVIEEFGYSRDQNLYSPKASTVARDAFYNFIFSRVIESYQNNGPIAGCNFWGWGGAGRPSQEVWRAGDDFLCDPPHEPQGWYSVFDSDVNTIQLIKNTAKVLNQ